MKTPEFINKIRAALEKKDYTCRNILSGYTIRKVIKEVGPQLTFQVVNKYYTLGVADWNVCQEKFNSKIHGEVYIDIDVLVNNLQHSFVRPYDIYLGE